MARIEGLNPGKVDDKEVSEVLKNWRAKVVEEMGKNPAKKFFRNLNMFGAVLQVEDGEVVRCFCLKELDEEKLSGMRGDGWLVYEGIVNRPGRCLGEQWKTEASSAEEVSGEKRRGYKPEYRHAKHRQEVKSSLRRLSSALRRK